VPVLEISPLYPQECAQHRKRCIIRHTPLLGSGISRRDLALAKLGVAQKPGFFKKPGFSVPSAPILTAGNFAIACLPPSKPEKIFGGIIRLIMLLFP